MVESGCWIECDDLKAQHRRIILDSDRMISNSVVLVLLAPESLIDLPLFYQALRAGEEGTYSTMRLLCTPGSS